MNTWINKLKVSLKIILKLSSEFLGRRVYYFWKIFQ